MAAISSEMNSCKKSVSFNFKKYVKFFLEEAAVLRVRYKLLPFTEMELYVGGK